MVRRCISRTLDGNCVVADRVKRIVLDSHIRDAVCIYTLIAVFELAVLHNEVFYLPIIEIVAVVDSLSISGGSAASRKFAVFKCNTADRRILTEF